MSNTVTTNEPFLTIANGPARARLVMRRVRTGEVSDDLTSITPKSNSIDIHYKSEMGSAVSFELDYSTARALVDKINEIYPEEVGPVEVEVHEAPTLPDGEVVFYQSIGKPDYKFMLDNKSLYVRALINSPGGGSWKEVTGVPSTIKAVFSSWGPMKEISQEEAESDAPVSARSMLDEW